MITKFNLNINWSALIVGLENDWLKTEEIFSLLEANHTNFGCTEDFFIKLLIFNDKKNILKLLHEYMGDQRTNGLKYWQLTSLLNIAQSEKPITQKLKDIEEQWVKFGYPEDWESFIYYMPNKMVNTPEAVYQLFLDYLNREQMNWLKAK